MSRRPHPSAGPQRDWVRRQCRGQSLPPQQVHLDRVCGPACRGQSGGRHTAGFGRRSRSSSRSSGLSSPSASGLPATSTSRRASSQIPRSRCPASSMPPTGRESDALARARAGLRPAGRPGVRHFVGRRLSGACCLSRFGELLDAGAIPERSRAPDRGLPRCYQLLVAARQSTMSKGADGRRPSCLTCEPFSETPPSAHGRFRPQGTDPNAGQEVDIDRRAVAAQRRRLPPTVMPDVAEVLGGRVGERRAPPRRATGKRSAACASSVSRSQSSARRLVK